MADGDPRVCDPRGPQYHCHGACIPLAGPWIEKSEYPQGDTRVMALLFAAAQRRLDLLAMRLECEDLRTDENPLRKGD